MVIVRALVEQQPLRELLAVKLPEQVFVRDVRQRRVTFVSVSSTASSDSRSEPPFFRSLSQNVAMSSAEVLPEMILLQNTSHASFSARWNSESSAKHVLTYATYVSCSAMTSRTKSCSAEPAGASFSDASSASRRGWVHRASRRHRGSDPRRQKRRVRRSDSIFVLGAAGALVVLASFLLAATSSARFTARALALDVLLEDLRHRRHSSRRARA